MNDISSIATAIMDMQQSQTQTQISASMMKMSLKAEQEMANMLLQNAQQIAAMSHAAAGGVIDTFT
ncbi:MAG TPA: putative motility protein [Smithellaceae bacterium]|nr:putative motility protein [Smithellaceae bacterium]